MVASSCDTDRMPTRRRGRVTCHFPLSLVEAEQWENVTGQEKLNIIVLKKQVIAIALSFYKLEQNPLKNKVKKPVSGSVCLYLFF